MRAQRNAAATRSEQSATTSGARVPPLAAYVADAVAGDEVARAQLIEALLPRARNLVRYLVRGDHEADDIVQDALLTVLERLHSYRGTGRLEHWVDGVVMRVTLTRLRRMRRRLRRFVSSPPEELEAHSGAVGITPALHHYRVRRQVVKALDKLPYKQRHALVLHHVMGMTAGEVGRELGVPSETVHSRLRVGMQKLRRHTDRLRELSREDDES